MACQPNSAIRDQAINRELATAYQMGAINYIQFCEWHRPPLDPNEARKEVEPRKDNARKRYEKVFPPELSTANQWKAEPTDPPIYSVELSEKGREYRVTKARGANYTLEPIEWAAFKALLFGLPHLMWKSRRSLLVLTLFLIYALLVAYIIRHGLQL